MVLTLPSILALPHGATGRSPSHPCGIGAPLRSGRYLACNDIPANPVYERFRRLGAPEDMQGVSLLVDGPALAIGRAVWLCRGWPQLWQQLVEVLPRLREFA